MFVSDSWKQLMDSVSLFVSLMVGVGGGGGLDGVLCWVVGWGLGLGWLDGVPIQPPHARPPNYYPFKEPNIV